jgi:polyphosphate kinase
MGKHTRTEADGGRERKKADGTTRAGRKADGRKKNEANEQQKNEADDRQKSEADDRQKSEANEQQKGEADDKRRPEDETDGGDRKKGEGGRSKKRNDGFDPNKLTKKKYEAELERLQKELVKLQEWVREKSLRVVVLFEGRDAAGKGGVISRIASCTNPRICRVVALGTPSGRQKTQWYFQRYVAELPAAGEIVLFDRSWYNRAGVERVMGFCDDEELEEFFRAAPEFERMLIRSGIILIKYWFSVSDDVQEKRFQDRMATPVKRWKLSPMDIESRAKWVDYSRAKDEMFAKTDTSESRWWVVPADRKKKARLNCISHLLSCIPYEDLTPKKIKLPPRQTNKGYKRPPESDQHFVPEKY